MNYPNGKKVRAKVDSQISMSKRGMSLESDINTTNESYLIDDEAIIYKKPTPITIVKTDYPKRSAAKITEAYFNTPSTTDYNGIYRGKYIDFEAKECQSKTSFPFSSIHPHQVEHLKRVLKHGAIAFIIIRMSLYDTDYLIEASKFIEVYEENKRKSITYKWINENGYKIKRTYQKPCDYLDVVSRIYEL